MMGQEKSSVVSNPPPQQDTAEGAKESWNRANITALRDFVARAEFKFNMASGIFQPVCGTAGCIGGHAAALWSDVAVADGAERWTFDDPKLADKLGIPERLLDDLCYPGDVVWGRVTREDAIRVLTTLAETGEVVWPSQHPESP